MEKIHPDKVWSNPAISIVGPNPDMINLAKAILAQNDKILDMNGILMHTISSPMVICDTESLKS